MKIFQGDRPNILSPVLQGVISAIEGRSKAFGKLVSSVRFEQYFLPQGGDQIEVLDVLVDTSITDAVHIRLSVYSDWRVVVRVTKGGKSRQRGLKIQARIQYRPPSDIVVCLEETINESQLYFKNEISAQAIEDCWRRLENASSVIDGKRLRDENWG